LAGKSVQIRINKNSGKHIAVDEFIFSNSPLDDSNDTVSALNTGEFGVVLPTPLTIPTAASYKDHLYVYGGVQSLPSYFAGAQYNQAIYRMSAGASEWEKLVDAHAPALFPAQSAIVGDCLMVYGMSNGELWAYHIPTKKWSRVTTSGTSPAPVSRQHGLSFLAWEESLYVLSGDAKTPGVLSRLKLVSDKGAYKGAWESFITSDPSGHVNQKGVVQELMAHPGVVGVALDGRLFYYGGYRDGFMLPFTVVDLKSKELSELSASGRVTPRLGFSLGVMDNIFYVIGGVIPEGEAEGKPLCQVWSLPLAVSHKA